MSRVSRVTKYFIFVDFEVFQKGVFLSHSYVRDSLHLTCITRENLQAFLAGTSGGCNLHLRNERILQVIQVM